MSFQNKVKVTASLNKFIAKSMRFKADMYEVEEVLDHRKGEEITEYLVKWLGYDKPSWIPYSAAQVGLDGLIDTYFQGRNKEG